MPLATNHARPLAALLLALPLGAAAGDGHHRHHATHVHGHGELTLAQEGPAVHIGLVIPAADVVGFEHPPATATQGATVERAVATLRDGARMFQLTPQAGCRLEDVRVDTALLSAAPGADSGGDDPGPGKAGADTPTGHSDVRVDYRFQCARPEALTGLTVNLFEAFPAAQRLRVQVITDRGPGAAELTPGRTGLSF